MQQHFTVIAELFRCCDGKIVLQCERGCLDAPNSASIPTLDAWYSTYNPICFTLEETDTAVKKYFIKDFNAPACSLTLPPFVSAAF